MISEADRHQINDTDRARADYGATDYLDYLGATDYLADFYDYDDALDDRDGYDNDW